MEELRYLGQTRSAPAAAAASQQRRAITMGSRRPPQQPLVWLPIGGGGGREWINSRPGTHTRTEFGGGVGANFSSRAHTQLKRLKFA